MEKWQLEEEKRCVYMAKEAVKAGNAGCWKTVAGFLYDEVLRLEQENNNLIKGRGRKGDSGDRVINPHIKQLFDINVGVPCPPQVRPPQKTNVSPDQTSL